MNTQRPRSSPILNFVRNAHHKSEGRANGPKQGPGKRLGAKKTGEQYVIPGNIIFRQRGTQWHPGDNVGMGRDHTIFALEPGYVKYYRNPDLHPKRRYIGVVLHRNDVLPRPPNAARRRRLGMIAVPRTEPETTTSPEPESDVPAGIPSLLPALEAVSSGTATDPSLRKTSTYAALQPREHYRAANWEIGRAPDRAAESGTGPERQRVSPHKFVKKDRFAALKARKVRAAKIAEKRGPLGQRGPKGKDRKKRRRGR
ncbi:MAG: hypothetical protein Q9165_004970 [Trypethelium subeluteriae]